MMLEIGWRLMIAILLASFFVSVGMIGGRK